MKKLLVALAIFCSTVAIAGSGSKSGVQESTALINVAVHQRVLMWSWERNVTTRDGEILICTWDAKSDWRDSSCTINGKNAWISLLEHKIPGYYLTHYEYRFVGSAGSRLLVTYWTKL